MEQTKNTTAVERRIARRAQLAEQLTSMATVLRQHGFEGKSLDIAAIELKLMNTEDVLSQSWASDPPAKPTMPPSRDVPEWRDPGKPKPMFAEAGRIMRDAQPDLERQVVGMIQSHIELTDALLAAKPGPSLRDGDPLKAIHDEMLETMRSDPVETGRTTVTVGAVNIPGRREPGISLQAGADGRLAPAPDFVTLPPGMRFEPTAVVIRFGRREVVVRCARKGDDHVIELFGVPSGCEGAPLGCLIEIPDKHQPLCTLVFKTEAQAMRVFDALHAGTPHVTDAMLDRALDGWDQWWNGYTGVPAIETTRAAMRHALQQALGVRS